MKLGYSEVHKGGLKGHLNHPEGQLGESACQLRGIWVHLSQRRGYLSSPSNLDCPFGVLLRQQMCAHTTA